MRTSVPPRCCYRGDFWDVPIPCRRESWPADSSRSPRERVGARVYWSMYHSTSVDGETPVAVTGTIWVPETPPPEAASRSWPGAGRGIGDDCALSRHPDRDYRGSRTLRE